jgi:transcriptional regulator with XRE-family HTH domain
MKHSPHAELREQLADLKISQAEFARATDVEYTTVNRWANGKRPIPGLVWAYLDLKRQLRDIVKVASEAADSPRSQKRKAVSK